MAITMSELKKNMKKLEDRVDLLCKNAVVDGADVKTVEQFHSKPGSGTTGKVPEDNFAEGAVVDGTQKKPERGLDSKGGSGASVPDKFVGMNQTGKYVNDGASDKEVMIKGCGGKKKAKGKGVATPQKAGVPAPKKKGKK